MVNARASSCQDPFRLFRKRRPVRRRASPWLALLALVVLAAPACAARDSAAADPGFALQPGTIKKVGSLAFGIVPDADPGSIYAPEKLGARFRVDGLRVLFAGAELPQPPGVRMWGRPFRVTTIRAADPAR